MGYYSNEKRNSQGQVINQLPNASAIVSAIANNINKATNYNSNLAASKAAANNALKFAGTSKTATTNKSGGTTKKSGTSTGGTQPTSNTQGEYIDYEAIYRAQAEAEAQREAERLAALRAAANEAYNNNMARIASSYDSAAGNLRSNYDSTVDRLNAARDKSIGDVNSDAEKSLQEAYINNMLTKKNLNQRLAAMGYNGGATETTMGRLENQYGASRTGINEALNKSLADLNQTYGDNLAGALQSYNSAMSNLGLQRMQLENQAENARNNLIASYTPQTEKMLALDQNYVNALKNVLARQGQFTFDPTKATNDYIAGNAQQAQGASQGSGYQKYLALLDLEAQRGTPVNQIIDTAYSALERGELGFADVADIFERLGISI